MTPCGTAINLSQHPFFAGAVNLTRYDRPAESDDEATTGQTIGVMAALSKLDSTAPAVIEATRQATQGCITDGMKAAGIHRWIAGRIHFVEDSSLAGFDPRPDEAEVLVRPVDLLAMPQPCGDCDDFSMLAAAMLRAAGIPSAFVTVAADPTSPDYSHVYVLVFTRAGAIPLDASHGRKLGWEAPAIGKRRVWQIETESNLHGLGFDWTAFSNVLSQGVSSAGNILGTRYAVPQLNPGQYIQNANGIMYQQPAGSTGAIPLPFDSQTGTMLLLGGLLLVVVIAGGRR